MVTLEILGMGCAKCNALAERTEQAARELGLEYRLEKIVEVERLASFRILSTPALAINGAVQFAGRVPTVTAIKELLAATLAAHA